MPSPTTDLVRSYLKEIGRYPIESSPYRQEETQSDELQEWEGYSWVIFCFEVRAIARK